VAVLVFYRGPRAFITQHVFETVHVARLQYAINDLTNVHIVRFDPAFDPGHRVLGLSTMAAAFMVIPIVGPVSKAVAGLAAIVLLAGSILNMRRRSAARWELVATCDGRPVTLFKSENQGEFDQVCRGLQRALEQRTDDR
jgi:hypothetical protein